MRLGNLTAALLATAALSTATLATSAAAADNDSRQFNPDVLVPSFSFGQFNAGPGFTADGDSYMLFGGRGGTYFDDSDRWYIGGGGRGGFSIDDTNGGIGYGYIHTGNRGPITPGQDLGLDAYAGLAYGGYGNDTDDGYILGPVIGTALYLGANRSFEIGLHSEMVANAIELEQSVFTIGIAIGGKGGEVSIPWERREDVYR